MTQQKETQVEKSRFLDLIKNYNNLSGMDRQILKNNILKHPYCTILHTLYAKSYYQGDTGNIEELNIAAIYAPNRRVLKRTIDGNLDLNSLDFHSNEAFTETPIAVHEDVLGARETTEPIEDVVSATVEEVADVDITPSIEEVTLEPLETEQPVEPEQEKTSFWKKGIFGATLAAGAAAVSSAATESKEAITESAENIKESTTDKVDKITPDTVANESIGGTVFDRKVDEIKAQEAAAEEVEAVTKRKTVLEQKMEELEAQSKKEVDSETTSFFDDTTTDTEVSTVIDKIKEEKIETEAAKKSFNDSIDEMTDVIEPEEIDQIDEKIAEAEAPIPFQNSEESITDTDSNEITDKGSELPSSEHLNDEDKSERISDLETSMAALKAKRLAFLNDDDDDDDDEVESDAQVNEVLSPETEEILDSKPNIRDQIKALEEDEITEEEIVVEPSSRDEHTLDPEIEKIGEVEEEIVHEFSNEKLDGTPEIDADINDVFSEDLASQFKDVDPVSPENSEAESKISIEEPPIVTKPFDRKNYRQKQKAIIEKFMTETNVSKKILKNSTDESKANDPLTDLAASSTTLPSDIYTETLAQLNMKQGNREVALEIYEKLILKNPDKKAYFASKIQELKNL